jgi:hypothetical protein
MLYPWAVNAAIAPWAIPSLLAITASILSQNFENHASVAFCANAWSQLQTWSANSSVLTPLTFKVETEYWVLATASGLSVHPLNYIL